MPRLRQSGAATMVLIAGLAVFKLVELSAAPRYVLETPLDSAIPFVPITLPVYLAFFPYLIAASALADRREFRELLAATLLALAIALACFSLFPAAVSRPDPQLIESAFLRQRFTRMWSIDSANNTFPSLHVAATCLASAVFAKRRHGWLAIAAAVLICASTLTVKQHALADVAGGAALAAAARAMMLLGSRVL